MPPGAESGPVLITGATSGLGLALAHLYASKRYSLVLVGRRPLAELDPDFFNAQNYCQADLSKPDAVQAVPEFLDKNQIGALELLIHNAGTGLYGEVTEHSGEAVKTLLEVNLYTPIALTHALLSRTRKVVFVSSVVADVPAPKYAVYGSSKAALDAFARNLRLELRNSLQTKMQVQTVHPGAIRTEMHRKSGVPEEKFSSKGFPSAERVAEEVFRAVSGSRKDVTVGVSNKLLRFAGVYLAAPLDTAMRKFRARG